MSIYKRHHVLSISIKAKLHTKAKIDYFLWLLNLTLLCQQINLFIRFKWVYLPLSKVVTDMRAQLEIHLVKANFRRSSMNPLKRFIKLFVNFINILRDNMKPSVEFSRAIGGEGIFCWSFGEFRVKSYD